PPENERLAGETREQRVLLARIGVVRDETVEPTAREEHVEPAVGWPRVVQAQLLATDRGCRRSPSRTPRGSCGRGEGRGSCCVGRGARVAGATSRHRLLRSLGHVPLTPVPRVASSRVETRAPDALTGSGRGPVTGGSGSPRGRRSSSHAG